MTTYSYTVHQHWDPLELCMVGKSYPPEFYSWIENTSARNSMERIAMETEEDYQQLIKLLKSFNIEIIRPKVSKNHEDYHIPITNQYSIPPMTPRDYLGTYTTGVFFDLAKHAQKNIIHDYYEEIKDPSWPEISSFNDIKNLPSWILNEMINDFNFKNVLLSREKEQAKLAILDTLQEHNINPHLISKYTTKQPSFNTANVCRVGKDLFYPGKLNHSINDITSELNYDYNIHFYNGNGHADGCFCPVVPGLIISLLGFQNYEETFPGWEVIELPNQSWNKIKPFMELKNKNRGKWWVPGEENNNALTETVEEWLKNWMGYVEETVFDVNMLVINEQNVVVNNYNKKVFDALERYGVTPHICNFRHRYFWDGGIHCITSDLSRKGEMKDYFLNRS